MIDMQLVCINQLYFSGSPARVDDMGRSRQRKPHPSTALPGCVPVEVQEMELDTLYGYVAKAQRELLNDAEAKALHASLQTLGVLMEELKRKGTTLRRLQAMLFGSSSEKTDDVFPPTAPEPSVPGNTPGRLALRVGPCRLHSERRRPPPQAPRQPCPKCGLFSPPSAPAALRCAPAWIP